MSNLSDLEEVLMVLAGLKNQLEPCLRNFKRYRHDKEAQGIFANYLLILVASFEQEWQRFEAFGKDPKVRRTLTAAAPALKRIRKWRGLHRLRSSMLAHGFRDKDGRLVNVATLFGANAAPTNYEGRCLLGELAVYALATAMCHHRELHHQALQSLLKVWPDEEPEACGISSKDEFDQEIECVRSEIFSIDPHLEMCFSGHVESC